MFHLWFILFLLIIILIGFTTNKEHFEELLSSTNLFVLQGNSIPLNTQNLKINFDETNPAAQYVDGKGPNVPKAVFPWTFNKCSIDCCNKNSNLLCNSGCVCITDDQINNFFGKRQ